jgi:hypothetical protein
MATLEEQLDPAVVDKVRASIAVTDKVNVTTIDAAVPEDELSIDSFFSNRSKESVLSLRPEDVEKKDTEVELALQECEKLTQQVKDYHEQFIVRGDRALYRLLADIYGIALKIRLSEYRSHIHVAMISALRDRNIKVQENTSEMTVLIKYIVGSDRRRAANFSRVLEVALKENLSANDLPAYIERRGGIAQIHTTEQESFAKEQGLAIQDKRTALLREMLINRAWESSITLNYGSEVFTHGLDGIDNARSDFVFFMTRFDQSKKCFKVLHAHKFGEKFENQLIRRMTQGVKADVETLQSSIARYRQSLVDKKLVPEFIADIWQKNQPKLESNLNSSST